MHDYNSYPRGSHAVWYASGTAESFEIVGDLKEDRLLDFTNRINGAVNWQRACLENQASNLLKLKEMELDLRADLKGKLFTLREYRQQIWASVEHLQRHLVQGNPAQYIPEIMFYIRAQNPLYWGQLCSFRDIIDPMDLPEDQARYIAECRNALLESLFAYYAQIIFLHAEQVVRFSDSSRAREIWSYRNFGMGPVRQDARDMKPAPIRAKYAGTPFEESDNSGTSQ